MQRDRLVGCDTIWLGLSWEEVSTALETGEQAGFWLAWGGSLAGRRFVSCIRLRLGDVLFVVTCPTGLDRRLAVGGSGDGRDSLPFAAYNMLRYPAYNR